MAQTFFHRLSGVIMTGGGGHISACRGAHTPLDGRVKTAHVTRRVEVRRVDLVKADIAPREMAGAPRNVRIWPLHHNQSVTVCPRSSWSTHIDVVARLDGRDAPQHGGRRALGADHSVVRDVLGRALDAHRRVPARLVDRIDAHLGVTAAGCDVPRSQSARTLARASHITSSTRTLAQTAQSVESVRMCDISRVSRTRAIA